QVKVFYGQADGSLGTPTTLTPSDTSQRMTAGDLNGDGRTDLIYKDAGFDVAYGQTNNTFSPVTHFSDGGYKYAATDLNGDGRLDMAMPSGQILRTYFGKVG